MMDLVKPKRLNRGEKVLFNSSPIGAIPAADEWTGERIEWLESN